MEAIKCLPFKAKVRREVCDIRKEKAAKLDISMVWQGLGLSYQTCAECRPEEMRRTTIRGDR